MYPRIICVLNPFISVFTWCKIDCNHLYLEFIFVITECTGNIVMAGESCSERYKCIDIYEYISTLSHAVQQ